MSSASSDSLVQSARPAPSASPAAPCRSAGHGARGRLNLLASLVLAFGALATASAQDLSVAPPPAPYVGVAEILPLPEFIPGAGALYIDPANAPVGPWLSYGSDGKLLEVLFMVPISAMNEAQNWDNLATGLLSGNGLAVDHVDVSYNGGHSGMAEPHYHIRLVLVDDATQQAGLTQ